MQPDAPFQEVGRRRPASGVHLYLGQPTIVVLTVNTEKRIRWLADSEAHHHLRAVWQEATAWLVSDYVLMPDHLHCLCAPHDLAFTIERWITYWKSQFAKRHAHADWRWQSRGWHHRLRSDESYSQKWRYLQENPVRWGLVTDPLAWPYQGRIHDVRW
jgi:putative transposase